MKLVETIYKGHDWRSGEDDVDRRVGIELIDEDEGKVLAGVEIGEGEPEDMTFSRDLNDVYSIAELVKIAYDLGRQGVEVSFEHKTEEL